MCRIGPNMLKDYTDWASLKQLNVHSNLFPKQIAVLDNDQVDACGDHGGWSAVANTRKCPKTQVSLSS